MDADPYGDGHDGLFADDDGGDAGVGAGGGAGAAGEAAGEAGGVAVLDAAAAAAGGAAAGGKGKAVDPSQRVTTRYMTKYERARLLGTRALQLRCAGDLISPPAAVLGALLAAAPSRIPPTPSARASQYYPRSYNAPPMVDPRDETDPLKIAMMELKENKIPLIVRRYLPDGSYEDWAANELIQ